MFTLSLRDYCGWDSYQLSVPYQPSLILLQGPSGRGKTTIFRAIVWCLYGEGKIAPRSAKRATTRVELSIPGFRVVRERPSELLVLEGKDDQRSYRDQAAQDVIDRRWGRYSRWLPSSYLVQGSLNYFFTAPEKEKLALLRELSFGDDTPARYRTILNTELLEVTHRYQSLILQLEAQRHQFDVRYGSTVLPDYPDDIRALSWPELEQALVQTQAVLNQLTEQQRQWTRRIELQSQLDQLPTTNAPLMPLGPTEDECTSWLPVVTRREYVNIELTNLNKILESYPAADRIYQPSDYASAVQLETRRAQAQEQARSVGVPYTIEAIQTAVIEAKGWDRAVEQRSLRLELVRVETELSTLKTDLLSLEPIPIIPWNDVAPSVPPVLGELLSCPHCQERIILIEEPIRLVKAKASDDSIQREHYSEQWREYSQREREHRCRELELTRENERRRCQRAEKIERSNRLDARRSELLLIIDDNIVPCNSTITQADLAVRRALEWYSEPEVPSQHILSCLDRQPLSRRRSLLETELRELQLTLDGRSWSQSELMLSLTDWRRYRTEHTAHQDIERRRGELQQSLVSLTAIPIDELEQARQIERHRWLQSRCQHYALEESINRDYNDLNRVREQALVLSSALDDLDLLAQYLYQAECEVLGRTVAGINAGLGELLDQLFHGQLQCRLSLTRTLKRSGITKAGLSIELTHHGFPVESLQRISGGEASRVSLALTLVLARLSGSGLLLLDELLVGLGADDKEVCLDLIRSQCSSLCLIIMHDSCEGWYDDTINF